MKKFISRILLVAMITLATVSCSKDDGGSSTDTSNITSGIFVLNEGNWGANDSELTYYNTVSGETSENVFFNANGKQLGDTANDILICGSKMYIAVSSSAIIFVTDLKGKIIKEIKVAGASANLSPRQLTSANGNVYASFMEGYVGKIDTTDFSVSTVAVGPMPEGIAYANNKIYVANSDGYNPAYGNTVSIIDAKTFTVTKTIEVATNPQNLYLSSGYLYLVCWGNYADKPAALQKINITTDQVTTIPNVEPNEMAIGANDVAYILASYYDANWNQTIKYFAYSCITDQIVAEFTTTDIVPNGYSITADVTTGNVYIGSSDYISNGDVYVLSAHGDVLDVFDTGALNPAKIVFIRK